jgi:hypothetical protein
LLRPRPATAFEFTRAGYHGIEDLGNALFGFAALGVVLLSNVVGMVAAGIGLRAARQRQVRIPALNVALVLNLVAFWALLVLIFSPKPPPIEPASIGSPPIAAPR